MFTGLVVDVGTVLSVETKEEGKYRRLVIKSRYISRRIRKGDSVAVNGVCLTVVTYSRLYGTFTVEVLYSSGEKTNLSLLQKHDYVNLELSLKVGDSLGGHFVLGHVESTGTIVAITHKKEDAQKDVQSKHAKEQQQTKELSYSEKNYFYSIYMSQSMMQYMCPEGSVTLDGISLTIAYIDMHAQTITVNIIPHTYHHTTLQYRKQGDAINIEPDMIIKHVSNMLVSRYNNVINKRV